MWRPGSPRPWPASSHPRSRKDSSPSPKAKGARSSRSTPAAASNCSPRAATRSTITSRRSCSVSPMPCGTNPATSWWSGTRTTSGSCRRGSRRTSCCRRRARKPCARSSRAGLDRPRVFPPKATATPSRSPPTIPPPTGQEIVVSRLTSWRQEHLHDLAKQLVLWIEKTGLHVACRHAGPVVRGLVRGAAARLPRPRPAGEPGEPVDTDRRAVRHLGDLLGRALGQDPAREFELREEPCRRCERGQESRAERGPQGHGRRSRDPAHALRGGVEDTAHGGSGQGQEALVAGTRPAVAL